MDRIEFVIAERELGRGVEECAEPVINGASLVELLDPGGPRAVGTPVWSRPGCSTHLSRPELSGEVQVLRCICGDYGCSWARVEVKNNHDEAVWQNFRGSGRDADAYAALGPFRFPRELYASAVVALARAFRE